MITTHNALYYKKYQLQVQVYRSTDKKAMCNSERTHTRTRQKSKRISRRIVLCASRPKLCQHHTREHVRQSTRVSYFTHVSTEYRSNASCKTNYALRDTVCISHSVGRCHWRIPQRQGKYRMGLKQKTHCS
jgi:hypothetical protein